MAGRWGSHAGAGPFTTTAPTIPDDLPGGPGAAASDMAPAAEHLMIGAAQLKNESLR